MRAYQSKLFEVAERQQGYFTTKQALAAGYIARTHHYHVGTGTWVREYRGIYRLAHFPPSPDGHYVLWTLWSRNRQDCPAGVFSHQTALSIHELSDIMPPKLHMTVPPGFRRNSEQPKVLVLHHSVLPESDIEPRQGYRVVRPLRAIIELLGDETESRDHLRQALQQGLSRGLITRNELRHHPERATLLELLGKDSL